MEIKSPIKHLYFFDDLSYHIRRICNKHNFTNKDCSIIVAQVWEHILKSLTYIDLKYQDFVLVNWDHVIAELAFHLKMKRKHYDIIISQGCNGEYALQSFAEFYQKRYGENISNNYMNVRVAHLLNDKDDPFYSDFIIGVSKGPSLLEQCDSVAKKMMDIFTSKESSVNIAIFDDCIQTGKGTSAVLDHISELANKYDTTFSIDLLAFIGCESTMENFALAGYDIAIGTLLRGKTYPESWEWDIYFLKDLFLSNSIRFINGESISYCSIDWYQKIFPISQNDINEFKHIGDILDSYGILSDLEGM